MDRLSLAGLLLSLIAILGGQVLEGGHIGSLIQPTAFLIVIGGTLGAVLLQSHWRTFLMGLQLSKWVFVPPAVDAPELIEKMIAWTHTARRGGLLALEAQVDATEDAYLQKGLQMLVDGAEPLVLRHALEAEINRFEDSLRRAAKIWESAGGYAPTVGILGAVMGLIHVMENLSDPSKLGSGIAVAFVATVYGVGSANLIFLPIANKLKTLIAEQVNYKEMIIEGLIAVANGENPKVLENRLQGYLLPEEGTLH